MKPIPKWHEKVLSEVLKWRESNAGFRFNLRTGEVRDEQRLRQGYWFTGNDKYLFFAPFAPNDPNNKTRTIGFVIEFDTSGNPKRSKIEIVFGGLKDQDLKKLHKRIADELGLTRNGNGDKYTRHYPREDPVASLQRFLRDDQPKISDIIDISGKSQVMTIPEERFEQNLSNTLSIREKGRKTPPADPTPSKPDRAGPRMAVINRILYGPPGTGKTYWMLRKLAEYTDSASAVSPEAWLHEIMNRSGWRAVIAASLANLGAPTSVPNLIKHRWIQAKARERGRGLDSIQQTLWSYLGEHTPENVPTVKVAIRREPFIFSKTEDSRWHLVSEWRGIDAVSGSLLDELLAGPKPGGEPFKRYRMVTFHPSYSYEDFVRGIRPVTNSETDQAQFKLVPGVFKRICDDARADPSARYALFIDEINRANIAKVFGELITLIELDKRAEYDSDGHRIDGVTVHLPGGDGEDLADDEFGVPVNLDIFGTMNTADRSIALLDIALRRRFEFIEMEPKYELLSTNADRVDLGELLKQINDRLEYLIDRDHRIGHAYFLKVRGLADLRATFKNQIIPLLQEYFFDDFAKVAKVLSRPGGKSAFVARRSLNHLALFHSPDTDLGSERSSYSITDEGSWQSEDFIAIYDVLEPVAQDDDTGSMR